MEREFWRILPYLLGGMFGGGVLLFLLSMHQLRRRRTGSYWRARRQAGERGGRLFIVAVFLIALSLVSTLVGGIVFLVRQPPVGGVIRGPEDLYGIVLPTANAQTAVADAATEASTTLAGTTEVPTLAQPSATPDSPTSLPATLTVALPPTNTPRASDTPALNFAVLLNLTPAFNTTPRPANADFRMTIEGASNTYATDSIPAALFRFDAGIKRIYLYISFERMEDGVAWSRVLYVNGTPLQGSTLLWNQGAAGRGSFFFGSPAGYDAGSYEIRLFVGEHEASRYAFVVTSGGGQTAVE